MEREKSGCFGGGEIPSIMSFLLNYPNSNWTEKQHVDGEATNAR